MPSIAVNLRRLWPQRPRARLFLVVSYLLWASAATRWLTVFVTMDHPQTGLIAGALLLYGALLGLEPVLTGKSAWRAHAYLAFQTGLVLLASLLHYELDFFAFLYLPVCGQAMFHFRQRTAMGWLGILAVATIAGQIWQFGWPESLSFTLLYLAGLVFVAAFSTITLQAEAERQRSQALLGQLHTANAQLRAYADQAEKLAVAQERNRLARDLHDSVAQTLYGLALQAEGASRRLAAGKLTAVAQDLREIGQSAQESLQETRLLIYELRPPLLAEAGLAAALRARLEAVEARSGLQVESQLAEVGRLPPAVETAVYRLAQEALNNVIKHARARRVSVSLAPANGRLRLDISDDGVGFAADAAGAAGIGLAGMRERAAQVGGRLEVASRPDRGTCVTLDLPL